MAPRTWTIQMMWQCNSCKTICPGIKGNERESLKCTHCGNEKTNEPWIMPDDLENAPKLTGNDDKIARSGENWDCKYCKSESRNSKYKCSVCGADRYEKTETNEDKIDEDRIDEQSDNSIPKFTSRLPVSSSQFTDVIDDMEKSAIKCNSGEGEIKANKSDFSDEFNDDINYNFDNKFDPERLFKILMIALALLVLIGFMIYMFSPVKTTVTVDNMSWQRAEDLEERHSRDGSGWRNSAPSSAYDFSNCEQRQNGTENCNPHECNVRNESYECNCSGGDSYSCNCRNVCRSNNNGSATCSESCSTCTTPRRCSTCSRRVSDTCYDQCATYAEHCDYKYYTWDVIRNMQLQGNDASPRWPNLPIGTNQRINRSESYRVIFHNESSPHQNFSETMRENEFVGFNRGQRWEIEYRRGTGISRYIRQIHISQ